MFIELKNVMGISAIEEGMCCGILLWSMVGLVGMWLSLWSVGGGIGFDGFPGLRYSTMDSYYHQGYCALLDARRSRHRCREKDPDGRRQIDFGYCTVSTQASSAASLIYQLTQDQQAQHAIWPSAQMCAPDRMAD